MNILERIEYLLKKKGWSKNMLHIRSGLAYSTISSIWKGYPENISNGTLNKIAKAFDVSLDYLVNGKDFEYDLTYDEIMLIKDFRKVDENIKRAIKNIVKCETVD